MVRMGPPIMDSLEAERLLDEMAEAAREAGAAILDIVARGFDVEQKGDLSPVTEADRAAELVILAALAKAAPGVPVIAPAVANAVFIDGPAKGAISMAATSR